MSKEEIFGRAADTPNSKEDGKEPSPVVDASKRYINPAVIDKMQLHWSYHQLNKSEESAAGITPSKKAVKVYDHPILDPLLEAYRTSPRLHEAGTVLIPLGALKAIRSLLALTGGRMVLLLGDKAFTRLADMDGHRDPLTSPPMAVCQLW